MTEVLRGFPAKIQIQTINVCNYSCDMCPYPDAIRGREKQRLAESVFDRVLEECAEREQPVELCLMLQNEPLLDRRFLAFARRAHACPGIRGVSTVTNGSLLDEPLLDALLELPRFQLTISLNATNREDYRRIHGQDRWERLVGLLTSWSGARERVLLSAVVAADAVALGREFREQWEPLGYPTRLVPMNQRSGSKPMVRALHVVRPEIGHCHYPLDTLAVLADGRVVLCCQDWQHERTFGDLNQASIAAIWNGPELAAIRAASVAGTIREVPGCRGCDYPMHSAERLRLEQGLAGVSPENAQLVHRARVRSAHGANADVAVVRASPDGHLDVVTRDELHAGLAIVLPLSYENGSVCEVSCRAEPAAAVELARGLRMYRLSLDRGDDGFTYFDWYYRDWHTNTEAARA